MYYFAQILIVIVLFSIQTTFLGVFAIGGVVPDLALIWVVYCGINFPKNISIGSGMLTGLLQDSLSGGLLGVNTLSKTFIGLLFSALKEKIFVEKVIPIAFFLVLSSIFDGIVFYFSMNTVLQGEVSSRFLYQSLPIYSFYNGITGPFLFSALNRFQNWLKLKTFNPHMTWVK